MRDPSLTLLLAVQVVVMFILLPLVADGVPIPPIVLLAVVLAIMALVVVVSRSPMAVVIGPVVFAIAIVSAVLRQRNFNETTAVIAAIGVFAAFAILTWVVATAVFASGRISFHRVQGAVVLYLNVAMMFASLYRLVVELYPGSFSGLPPGNSGAPFEASILYFSLTTLTSTGFGDIVPLHPFARSLANVESIIGQLYPATLLARIVTLEIAGRRP